MYSLLTLFVYPLTAKLHIPSYSSIRILITSICALPCPSFSRNSGRTSRRNICKNHKIESRVLDQGRNTGSGSESPLFGPFFGSSRGRVSSPSPPYSRFSFLPFRTISDGFSEPFRSPITMHNDASPATEECWRRPSECILRSFHGEDSRARYSDSAHWNGPDTVSLNGHGKTNEERRQGLLYRRHFTIDSHLEVPVSPRKHFQLKF